MPHSCFHSYTQYLCGWWQYFSAVEQQSHSCLHCFIIQILQLIPQTGVISLFNSVKVTNNNYSKCCQGKNIIVTYTGCFVDTEH